MTVQATSVVSIERIDNVIYLDFLSGPDSPGAGQDESAGWPWAEGPADAVPGKTPAATRPLPVRWSPRPVRTLAARVDSSPFADHLRERAFLIGLCIGLLAVYGLVDLALLLPPTLTGGTP